MELQKLIAETRTCRRFVESRPIPTDTLHGLIDLARFGGSARNCQPWQYAVVNESDTCDALFPHLGWAGYLSEWSGPVSGERPAAYILCLLNHTWLKGSEKEAHFDLGISTQNILLGASTLNMQGCRIGAFSPKVSDLFKFPEATTLELIIALGFPKEKIVIEEMADGADIKYWRDENLVHHVPKRALKDLIVQLKRQ